MGMEGDGGGVGVMLVGRIAACVVVGLGPWVVLGGQGICGPWDALDEGGIFSLPAYTLRVVATAQGSSGGVIPPCAVPRDAVPLRAPVAGV